MIFIGAAQKNPRATRWAFASVAVFLFCSFLGCKKGVKPVEARGLTKKWEFNAGGRIGSSLALGNDGTLYAASEDGFIVALDTSGKLQWKFDAAPLVTSPSVGLDGTIYFSDQKQRIYALNPSGTQQWVTGGGPHADNQRYWRGGAVDQTYFYTPFRGGLHAYRVNTGAYGWDAAEGYEEGGTVSILPNGLVVFPGPGRLLAVNYDGVSVWDYPALNPPMTVDLLLKNGGHYPIGNFWIASGIAVGRDATLYFMDDKSQLVAITSAGTLSWAFDSHSPAPNRATPVIGADDTIYVACRDGKLHALNPDGSEKWELATGGAIYASPVLAADGTVYVLNESFLLTISPEGKLLEKVSFPGPSYSSPTLASDGSLYVASYAGRIAAFSTTHGSLMESPWPKFQHDPANTGRAPHF